MKINYFIIFIILPLLLITSLSYTSASDEDELRRAVVKIYTTSTRPAYLNPWTSFFPEQSSGSGSIIDNDRILTNAHVVANSNSIQVQSYGSPTMYEATVLFVSHAADLAVLTVKDKSFFSNINPLKIGGLPGTMEEVLVYGFPVGGDSLSITKGVISRIEYQKYAHSDNFLLAGQIDASINPGNSGGPVISNNKIVGVTMQKIVEEETENIGYMIPTVVIKHFLTDISDGQYHGIPERCFEDQKIENPGMKRKYGMKIDQTGILVSQVYWNTPAYGKLEKGDIILEIDGHDIADNGTIELRPNQRVRYYYYLDSHQVGDEINLTVLRNAKIKNISYKLTKTTKDIMLVKSLSYDEKPTYFIYGGIVFSPLTENLLCGWEDCSGPREFMILKNKSKTEHRQEVAVAIQVLPAPINKGYHDMEAVLIKKVNGKEYKDFKEFYELVIISEDEYLTLEDDDGFQIVIDRKEADNTHQMILDAFGINEDKSNDLELNK
jgi:S1-C subfamily serine protease